MESMNVSIPILDYVQKCPFCGAEVEPTGEPYSDHEVYIENYVCSACGASGSARYVFEGVVSWQRQD